MQMYLIIKGIYVLLIRKNIVASAPFVQMVGWEARLVSGSELNAHISINLEIVYSLVMNRKKA